MHPTLTVIGSHRFPHVDAQRNVDQIWGPYERLVRLLGESKVRVIGCGKWGAPMAEAGNRRRGRPRGSTNLSRESFWAQYRHVAKTLKQPYRGTHMAAGIGLVYETFCSYMERWGPPPGYPRPHEMCPE